LHLLFFLTTFVSEKWGLLPKDYLIMEEVKE